MKKALITGVTGQDGSYLAEFLLKKGYKVLGIQRRSSSFNTARIDHIYETENFDTEYGDLTDSSSVNKIIRNFQPDEIYNLGAQTHVKVSFDVPEYTANTIALGTLRILEALRENKRNIKFYQGSSSEMFGNVEEIPQNEETPFSPRNPYACSKLFAYWLTINYREAYNLFACNGILFNHESPRRGNTFVTKKIVRGLIHIKKGIKKKLVLGNLKAKRDWGYAKEYVEAMWMMLQQKKSNDFVIATGEAHSVKEFVEECGNYLDMPIEWRGIGINQKGIDVKTGNTIIEISERYFRPIETDFLLGDSTKAGKILGWKPRVKFKDLVKIMVDAESGK
jgi:GDPmannose 4,6-dehydratase